MGPVEGRRFGDEKHGKSYDFKLNKDGDLEVRPTSVEWRGKGILAVISKSLIAACLYEEDEAAK